MLEASGLDSEAAVRKREAEALMGARGDEDEFGERALTKEEVRERQRELREWCGHYTRAPTWFRCDAP